MHPEAMDAMFDMVRRFDLADRSMRAIDIGGGDYNGSTRPLFGVKTTWDVLDPHPGPGVTVVSTVQDYTPDHLYDLAVCTEVLEHVQDWRGVLLAAANMLTAEGILLLTCASTDRPPHGATGDPAPGPYEWYENVAPNSLWAELGALFEYSHVHYNYPPGDAYAWAHTPRRD